MMAGLPGHLRTCLHTGKLALLAILVSGGIVLQILVGDSFLCLLATFAFSHLICVRDTHLI